MYKDLISYELAEGVSEAKMLNIAQQIIDLWMKNLDGFISWEIHRNKDNKYTDIVRWKSAIDAKNAEAQMQKIPNAAEWFGCYKKGSITSSNLVLLSTFSQS